MATINVTIDLVYGTTFPQIHATRSVAVGDVVNMQVNMTGIMNQGPRVSESGGTPVLGENKGSGHTFTYTVPYVEQAAHNVTFYFYGSKGNTGSDGAYYTAAQRMWGTTNRREGSFVLAVAAYSCEGVAPTGSITNVTGTGYTDTPYVYGIGAVAASPSCVIRVRATEQGAWNSGSRAAWGPANYFNYPQPPGNAVVRGSTYIFEASHVPSGYGASDTPGVLTGSPWFVVYTVADADISAANTTSTDGTFTVQLSGINQTSNTNKYMLKNNDGSVIYMSNGNLVTTAVGGTTISSNNAANGPAAGASKTYRVYGKRSQAAGGGSGLARYLITTASFTVSRPAGYNEVITQTSGSYFDRNAAAGVSFYLNLTGLNSSKYYNVFLSPTSSTFSLIQGAAHGSSGGWVSPTGSTATHTILDLGTTAPTGTGAYTATYYLWRSDNANGSGGVRIPNISFTRSLVVDDRFGFGTPAVTIGQNVTNVNQTITNTIPGHTYVIKRGSTTLASGVASGTTINFPSITESTLGASAGSAVTHSLYTQAPLNFAFAYSTGKSYTVTRTAPAVGSGYGLVVLAANGTTKLYDTTMRTARLWASNATGTVVAGGNSGDITVTGLTNSTTVFTIILVPQVDYGGANTLSASQGGAYTVQQNNNSFKVSNHSTIDQSYKYFIFKTGGA